MTTPPYVAPTPFRPGSPTNVSLDVLDSTSLRLALEDPLRDGGDAVDAYRVEWAGEPFVDEVQAVRIAVNASTEMQVIKTSLPGWWGNLSEVHLVHARLSDDYGASGSALAKNEWQLLECDSTGGAFTLSFDGLTTRSIAYNANPATVEAALEELTNIQDVSVVFSGADSPTTACVDGGEARVDFSNFDDYGGADTLSTFSAGINVTFVTVSDYVGAVPKLEAHTNELEGMRRIRITESDGAAGLGGTFALTFRGATTDPISWSATAPQLEQALLALDTVQDLERARSPCGYVSDESRRRRGCHADSPRGRRAGHVRLRGDVDR